VFASFMMGIAGLFQIIMGFAALFKDTVFVVNSDKLVAMNFDQWGWTHIILGAIVFLAAFSLAAGRTWGRVVGILLAILSAMANFVFLQAYPLWSLLIIAVDILVIYSIIMHGSELQEE
jgi:vacuolar-type H+-ATPase subunit I/STV1